jgi:hypothetical protein
VTRPKPTIYGNCDSWSFIVGKKPGTYRLATGNIASLQRSNMKLMHNLSTILRGNILDNLWVICGSAVNQPVSSRMVDSDPFNMPVMTDRSL